MSLTRFVALPDVKARFTAEFPLPSASLRGTMVAPPVTNHYSLVGTAFDYLMRFHLERLNPACVTQPWIAETSMKLTEEVPRLSGIRDQAKRLFQFAETSHAEYVRRGGLNDDILKSCIYLAQLDIIYRAAMVDPNMGQAESGDLEDLRNLFAVFPKDRFVAKQACLLNPSFGAASELVGGADADIVIDGALVDIKTVKRLEFTREQYNQLIGYLILNKIAGGIGKLKGATITRMGVYYSRYGLLHMIPTDSVDQKGNLRDFVSWFTDRAKVEYPED